VKLLKGMADQLGDEKQPKKAPPAPTDASAKRPPARPLTPAEYQARLAALRRPR
jgi:hypothetical protein